MDAKEVTRLSAKALAHIDTALGEADADRLGITAGQYPGLRIFDPHNTKENDR